MWRASFAGLDKKRLRLWLALFFLALAIPTVILISQAYRQLKWEAFHQHRLMAEELATRIDRDFIQLINIEEARSFTDYTFLNVAGDPSANFLQRSPLSAFPVNSSIPGIIGYFQVDASGAFSTPLLPQLGIKSSAYGISQQELQQRQSLQASIQEILRDNSLLQKRERTRLSNKKSSPKAAARQVEAPAAPIDQPISEILAEADSGKGRDAPEESRAVAQTAFDELQQTRPQKTKKKQKFPSTLGRVEDLKLDSQYQDKSSSKTNTLSSKSADLLDKRGPRKERSALPEQNIRKDDYEAEAPKPGDIGISIFESEIDAFEFSLLDSGDAVIYRKVWRDGQRYIQGALIQPKVFFGSVVKTVFVATALSQASDLAVAYQGNVLSAYGGQLSRSYLSSAEDMRGALLYQTQLSAPLGGVELIFSIQRLPAGPGGIVVGWVAATLLIVLFGGFYLMYRLGLGQITLARQQQDFVSAVSHELKTPLTSIRMYGEMLREGWASEDKKQGYYDYIHDESERLSRLIANVLQLARMTRNDLKIELKPIGIAELMDGLNSKLASQIKRAGFTLDITCGDAAAQSSILVDADYFIQIMINLVDNAIKFSINAEKHTVTVHCALLRDNTIQIGVRDYGPGVAKDQMKKIFKLFYRSENELTRETVGTGIGLALVHQLAHSMRGKVDVINQNPGAEFRLSFPVLDKNTKSSTH